MKRSKKHMIFILIFISVISLGLYFFFYGFPINKDKLVNEVKTYLVEQSDSEDGFKSIEVEYHFTSGHCVDVVYKDEPNVIYTYRYIEDVSEKNSKGKKVLIYYVKLTDGQDEEIYQFKHMHQEL